MGEQCEQCGKDLGKDGVHLCPFCDAYRRQLCYVEGRGDHARSQGSSSPAIDDLRGNDYLSGHDSSHPARPSRTCGTQNGIGVTAVSQCPHRHLCEVWRDQHATTGGLCGQEPAAGTECQRFPKPSADGGDAQELANALRCWYTRPRPPLGGTPRGPSISNMHGSPDITQKIEPPGAVEAVKAMGIDFDAEILNEPLVEPGKDAPIPRRHRWLGDVCAECGKAAPAEGPKPVEQVPPVSRADCEHVWSSGAPVDRVCTICGLQSRYWKGA